MRKQVNRVLACFLSVALLVSCCISGLILPAAAGGPSTAEPTNFFPNGDFEDDAQNAKWIISGKSEIDATGGVNGSKALKIPQSSSAEVSVAPSGLTFTEALKTGKMYIMSYRFKGAKNQIWNGGSTTYLSKITDGSAEWKEVFLFFSPESDITTLTGLQFINKAAATSDLWIDDISIVEYNKETTNLIPGSDGSVLPSSNRTPGNTIFFEHANGGATVSLATDPDNAENKVWKLTNIPTGNKYLTIVHSGKDGLSHGWSITSNAIAVDEIVKVSFRYKTADEAKSAALSVGVGPYADIMASNQTADGKWTVVNCWLRAKRPDNEECVNLNYLFHMNINAPGGLYVDDFSVTRPVMTGFSFGGKTEITLLPGEAVQLTAAAVIGGEEVTGVSIGALATWKSDNESLVTVDANGKATAVAGGKDKTNVSATVTLTDKKDPNISSSITVKVDSYANFFPNGSFDEVGNEAAWEVFTKYNGGTDANRNADDDCYIAIEAGKGATGEATDNALHFKEDDLSNGNIGQVAQFGYISNWLHPEAVANNARWNALLLPNRQYKLSFKVKGTVSARWYLPGSSTLEWQEPNKMYHAMRNQVFEDWTPLEFIVESANVTPQSVAAFTFVIDNYTCASDFYIDDLSFVLIQEEESMDITKDTVSMSVGESVSLDYTVSPQVNTVEWVSSDTSVVTVDDTGKVTALKLGQATITATSAEGKTDTCTVHVVEKATTLVVTPATLTLAPGVNQILSVAPGPNTYAGEITWSSSDETVATVDAATGKITTLKDGTATITATCWGTVTGKCELTVSEFGNMLVYGDFESEYTAQKWETNFGKIIPEPGNESNHVWAFGANSNVTNFWYSDDNYIGNVPTEGGQVYIVSGRVKGKAKPGIYLNNNYVAKIDGSLVGWQYPGTSDTEWVDFEFVVRTNPDAFGKNFLSFVNAGLGDVCYFDDLKLEKRVPPTLTGLTVSPETMEYGIGVEKQLTVKEVPDDALLGNLIWKSSNNAVATVDANGRITTTGVGTATITVESDKGFSDTCTVTVVKNAQTFELAKNKITLTPGATQKLHLLATPVGAQPSGTLQWSSDTPAVATVDNGVVTAVADGTATITVTNGVITDTCAVTVSEYGNVIIGGDFEDKELPSNWDAVLAGDKAARGDDDADDNNHTLMVKPGQTTGYYTGLTLENNEIYRFTAMVKGYIANVNVASAGIVLGAGSHATATEANFDEWTEMTFVFKTAATGTINGDAIFRFVGNNVGETHFDDITLRKLPKLTGISIPATDEVAPQNFYNVKVTPVPADAYIEGNVVWSTSDDTIATIDNTGKVTGIKEGNVTIKAEAQGFSSECAMKVHYYAGLLRNGDFTYMKENWDERSHKGHIVEGAGENGSNAYVLTSECDKYHVDNSYCTAAYTQKFVLIPWNTYKVTIRYKTEGNVDDAGRMWGRGMGGIYFKATKGEWQTKELIFKVPAGWKIEQYSSDINFLATDMIAKPHSTVYIDSIDLRMYDSGVEAEKVTLSPNEVSLLPGETKDLSVVFTPAEANSNFMTWSSSNENVATVDNGKITAVGGGTTTITVRAANGVSGTSTVKVDGNPAYLKNGTFDIADDTSWTLTGEAAVKEGIGYNGSKALAVSADGKAVQTITGLKANTTYQIITKLQSTTGASAKISLIKEGLAEPLLVSTTAAYNETEWKSLNILYTTPAEFDGDGITLVMENNNGVGTAIFDNAMFIEAFSDADLIVSDLMWNNGETQMKPGTKVNFTVVIANIGTEDTRAGQPIKVEIRGNGKTLYTMYYNDSIKAGDVVLLASEAENPWVAVAGDYALAAIVNPDMTVLESNRKNNGFQLNLRVAETFLEAPQVAQNAGMNTLIFSDDFDTLDSIDVTSSGQYGYKWYTVNGNKKDFLTPEDYELTEDGMILKAVKNDQNGVKYFYSVDMLTGAGWGGFLHGYVEIRVKMPSVSTVEGDGKGPTFWGLPTERLFAPYNIRFVELDFMEYYGDIYDKGDNGFRWTITLHDQETNSQGAVVRWEKNSNASISESRLGEQNDLGDNQWHVLGYVWDYGKLRAYMDGREVFALNWKAGEGADPAATVNQGDATDDVFCTLDKLPQSLIMSGSNVFPMEIDYVRIWQNDGTGEAQPEVPEKFVDSFLRDEEGNLFTELTAENYETIIDGAEAWAALSDAEQAAINQLLTDNGGKEYTTLLFEAQTLKNRVTNFVSFYACDENGDPYTEVTADNREWILSSLEEWNALTELEKAAINAKVLEICGMTFDEMLSAAENYGKSPVAGVPFPTVALVGLFLGGAAVFGSKKRRQDK